MLQASELRIGNYVNTSQGIGVVTTLDRDTKEAFKIGVVVKPFERYTLRNPDCTAIELTPEILHKNYKYSFQGQCWRIDLQIPNKDVWLIIKEDEHGFYYGIENTIMDWVIVDTVEYVHELQNIVHALSKTELNINL